jgi:hypothetical protein
MAGNPFGSLSDGAWWVPSNREVLAMKTSWILGLIAIAAVTPACASRPNRPCPPPPPAPSPPCTVALADGFERGVDGWQQGFDLPPDPNRPGQLVAWSITPSGEQAAEGATSARFYLDGRQDDGTIWLVRTFDVAPDTDVLVTLRFQLWSVDESFNTIAAVVAYAGSTAPAREADFDRSRRANDAAGWASYEYVLPARTDATGRIHVAFGVSAVWETEMVYFVDDVDVCIE